MKKRLCLKRRSRPQKLCSWTHGTQIVCFEQNTHHSLISSCHRIFTGWLKLKIETYSSSILAMSNLRGGCGAIPTLSLVDEKHKRGFRRGHARDQHDHHQDLRHLHPLIFPALVLSDSQLFLLSGHILFHLITQTTLLLAGWQTFIICVFAFSQGF